MAERPSRAVCLDTSVWVKLWLPEPFSDLVYDLFSSLLDQDWTLIGPPTLPYEVASVLRGKVRSRVLSEAGAQETWAAFRRYPLTIDTAVDLPDRTWAVATRLQLPTAYDAAFLAAAGSRPFVTADRVLLDACRGDRDVHVVDLTVAQSTLLGDRPPQQ